MAKKRKTLPANFEEIVAKGDLVELIAVFDKCEVNAYGGYWKGNALTFRGISEEFIRWIVEKGADVNAGDTWGYPPISYQTLDDNGNLRLLLDLGADIEKQNNSKCTPLCHAASSHKVKAVRALVENGADVNAENNDWCLQGKSSLEYSLMRCSNIDIPAMAVIADILLEAGTVKTAGMKDYVKKIGETFEFYRAGFNKNFLAETEKALNHLYELFEVEPVAKRKFHDGTSPIHVESTTWQQQFDELWQMLIPGKGCAKTVQGEVIRITGKVSREILDNGAPNWDKEYKKLPQALPVYFAMGNSLEVPIYEEAKKLANNVSANSEDKELNRLCELAVKWVLINPNPIALPKVDYDR